MKYIVKLRKTVETTVVIDAANDEEADRIMLSGDWTPASERVVTPDVYCGHEYVECIQTQDHVITSLEALQDALGTADVERYVYKHTDCGCCFRASQDYVAVNGYAEGSGDAECPEHILYFPFTMEQFSKELADADREGCDLWDEFHEDGVVF